MRVGVVTTSFPRFCGDYAGCFVEDDVRARLASGAAAVDVVAAASGHPAETNDRPDLGPHIRVVRVDPRAGTARHAVMRASAPLFYGAGAPEALEAGGLGIWLEGARFSLRLRQTVARLAPDWDQIVAHWLVPCAVVARLAAPGLPLLGYAHSGDIALLERLPGGRTLARWLAADARTKLRFVSDDLRRRFARLAGSNAHDAGEIVPAGSPAPAALLRREANARAHARAALGLRRWTVLAIGRLVPIKGFDVLVRAMALANAVLSARRQEHLGALAGTMPMTAVILGDGPERDRLRRLAERLDVEVSLPGAVPRSHVATWLAGADLYVQPSRMLANGRSEGNPLAAREALAAGLPVVATATGGLARLGEDAQPVQLIAPGDHAALADAIADAALRAHHGGNAARVLAQVPAESATAPGPA